MTSDEQRDSVDPYQVSPACQRPPVYGPTPSHAPPQCTLAVISMAMGIASVAGFISCGLLIFLAPVAVVLGHLARRQLREDPRLTGAGMATAGLVMGYIGTALLTALTIALVVLLASES